MFDGLKKCDLIEAIIKVDPSLSEVRGKLWYKSREQLRLLLKHLMTNSYAKLEVNND